MTPFWKRIPFLKGINGTVKEMWLGIGLWGLAAALTVPWFVKDVPGCLLGLLAGCLLACVCVWHMWKTLDAALELGDGAQRYMTVRSLARYGVIVLVFVFLMVTERANPLTAFLGLMGMKVSAYLQPSVHKYLEKRRR